MTNDQPAVPSDDYVMRAALAWADAADRMADLIRDAVADRDGALFGLTALASAVPGVPTRAIIADAIAREATDGITAARVRVAVAA